MSIQPKDSGGGSGETRESVVTRQADDMLEKLPNDYIPHEVRSPLFRNLAIIQRDEEHFNVFLFARTGESATSENGSSGVHEHLSETRD